MIALTDATVTIDDVTLLPATTLTVAEGSWHCVRGANGSGKSTLLSLVAGRRAATTGEVLVDGQPPADRETWFRSRVASLLHPPIVARDLTIGEHLTLVAMSWGAPQPRADALAELATWQLAGFDNRFAHELSSGQQQLFALACTFVRPSRLLVLDEPEQRLDADRRGVLSAQLRSRVNSGTTVLMATHADDVADASDEVTWLAQKS